MAREPTTFSGVGVSPATERDLEEARRQGITLPQVLPPPATAADEVAPIDPATGTQVIEVTPRQPDEITPEPSISEAPVGLEPAAAPGGPGAVGAPPAPSRAPAQAPPAPPPPPPLSLPDSFGDPGEEFDVASSTLTEIFRRLRRVQPDSMPAPRAMDFVEMAGTRMAVRQATQQEADEVARIVGQNAQRPFTMISMRGDYMPEDTQRFIDAVRQANQSVFDDMRRGVQTREQAVAAAERIGLDGAARLLLERRPGETFNSEQLAATVLAVQNAFSETQRASAALAAATPGTPQAAQAARQFGLNLAFTASIVAQANGAAAEAGRALGMLGNLSRLTSQAPRDLELIVRRFGADAAQPGANPMAAIVDMLGGEEVLRAHAAAWVALPDAAARARFAQASLGRRTFDAVIEAYINSLLVLPTTHMVNILGSASFGMWSVPERFLAGAIGGTRNLARNAMGMDSTERVMMGEAFAQLAGMYNSLGDALRLAGQTWRSGVPHDGISRLEMQRYNAISAEAFELSGTMGRAVDILGTVARVPGRALITEDAFFKTIGQRGELYAQAYRHVQELMALGVPRDQAVREAAQMMQHPPERWRDAADAVARAMTFQHEMGPYLSLLAQVMQHPGAKLFVPFFTTPMNVARAALHRTPMAVFLSPQVISDIRAGGARADLAISRIALGSAVMWYFSTLALNSHSDPNFRITGAAPAETAKAQAFRRQGLQEYSVCERVDGRWSCHSYARVDPVSALLGMAADTAQFMIDHPQQMEGMEDKLVGMSLAAASGLYEYVLSLPFTPGVSDLARILSDREAAVGETKFERGFGLFAEKVANAITMPLTGGTLTGAIERSMDPTPSNTRPDDLATANSNPIRRSFDRALQQARSRIPGVSEGLPPTLNIWGEPAATLQGGALILFWPFRRTSGRGDALEDRLLELGGVLAMPSDKFPGTDVRVSGPIYNRMIEVMNAPDNPAGDGRSMREQMSDMVTDPAFQLLDPKDQIDAIRQVRSKRWRAATDQVLEENAELFRRVSRDREHRAIMGISPPAEAWSDR